MGPDNSPEPLTLPCEGCSAEPGEPCRPWCTARPEPIAAGDIVVGETVVLPSGDRLEVAALAAGPLPNEVSLFHPCGERYILPVDAIVGLLA